MDNAGSNSLRSDDLDKPIPLDDVAPPTPPKEQPAGGPPGVSRARLSLGGAGAGPAPRPPAPAAASPATTPAPAAAPRVQAPPTAVRRPIPGAPAGAGRITNCKTFFTKLHPGAIEFLNEQISAWLKENPGIVIKHTNVTTGEVQAKKTEPNLLITVWY